MPFCMVKMFYIALEHLIFGDGNNDRNEVRRWSFFSRFVRSLVAVSFFLSPTESVSIAWFVWPEKGIKHWLIPVRIQFAMDMQKNHCSKLRITRSQMDRPKNRVIRSKLCIFWPNRKKYSSFAIILVTTSSFAEFTVLLLLTDSMASLAFLKISFFSEFYQLWRFRIAMKSVRLTR